MTVDIAREIGARLGVPVEPVCFDAARASYEAMAAGRADLCFLAVEPAREAEVAFTAPYVVIDGVFAVPGASAFRTAADVDRAGVRIGVKHGSAYDLFLSRTLRHASVVRGEEGGDVGESPRWLADRGRMREAEATMALIEAKVEAATGAPLPDAPPDAPANPAPSPGARTVAPATAAERAATGIRGLFTGRYRRRTLLLGALWFTGYFVNYGISSWLPTLYGSRFHLGLSDALLHSTVTSVAGLLGCLVAALTVDRIGRRRIFALFLGGTAAALLVLAALGARTPVQVLIWTSLAAVCFFGSNICLYLYTPELYPTRMRALGCSVGGALNRVGVILGPLIVGAVYAGGTGLAAVFATLGAVALAGALTAAFFAEETTDRPLEEVSP
ncbi:MFS transporter [Streptomyces pinistramenti]|uniref:MFS transporter n=1 Tax=Streptomyces pinistramenti TaxID=2884812 RepID=UPI0027E4B598|nr:MFS transporter [Streptomyces pinistramenti]